MTTRIIIVALILCTSFMAHAQVEQVAQQLAENEYRKFAVELPNAFTKGKVDLFGNAKALKKQFFLEENAQTFADYLGWDKKKYSQRTLSSVFKALSDNAKPGKNRANPVLVTFDFPVDPMETVVTVKKDKKGTPQKKETVVDYVVTTKANVRVEASKDGVTPSIASNQVALVWDGRINLINGEVNSKKKAAPPRLRTIVITPETDAPVVSSEPKEELMQARAKELIEEYYRNLRSPANRSAVLAPEIPNKANFENWLQNNTKIEIAGNINVPLPSATSQSIEVRNVPGVKIYVDPVPYLKEDISRYSRIEAYHQLALAFTVDFQADRITRVVFEDRFFGPELAPTTVATKEPEKKPVIPAVSSQRGLQYKVQILLRDSYVNPSELPQRFRVDNVTVEKYSDGYKYVIPAGSLNEAFAIRERMIANGIEDAWIAVYENGVRIRPPQGRPENTQ